MSSLSSPDPLDYAAIDLDLKQHVSKESDLDDLTQQPSAIRPHEDTTRITKEPFDYDGIYLEG